MPFLDQLSTTQKIEADVTEISAPLFAEIAFQVEQSYSVQDARCSHGAPYICYKDCQGVWHLVQGCCNNWLCPRCGQIRARTEYGRIVHGARLLAEAGNALFFHTLTCRGKDLKENSDDDYLKWTNRLLSAFRADAKHRGKPWHYVQVTERQKRGAAHSHIISTYCPADAIPKAKGQRLFNGAIAKHDCLDSQWAIKRNLSAGLGKMYDLSKIDNPVAVAVYVSKYLFKDMQTALFPKGWKRIRYSQNWPDLPLDAPLEAFPVVRYPDWRKIAAIGLPVRADSLATYEAALARLISNVVFYEIPA